MRKFALFLAALLAFAGLASAQAMSTVTLTWQDNLNPAGTKYNIYRATGKCGAEGLAFTKQNADPVSGLTYSQQPSDPGHYCYRVTSYLPNLPESSPSNTAEAGIPPRAPNGLSIAVSVTVTVQ